MLQILLNQKIVVLPEIHNNIQMQLLCDFFYNHDFLSILINLFNNTCCQMGKFFCVLSVWISLQDYWTFYVLPRRTIFVFFLLASFFVVAFFSIFAKFILFLILCYFVVLKFCAFAILFLLILFSFLLQLYLQFISFNTYITVYLYTKPYYMFLCFFYLCFIVFFCIKFIFIITLCNNNIKHYNFLLILFFRYLFSHLLYYVLCAIIFLLIFFSCFTVIFVNIYI